MIFAILGAIVGLPIITLLIFAFLRKQKCPEKAFKHALIETALTPMRIFRLGPFKGGALNLDKTLKASMKKTGLSDFGGMAFVDNYRMIMECKNFKSQVMTNIGYIAANIELTMTWSRRLKFIQYLKEVPEVVNVPLRSPVFVMGLPRTGTTFLHRLLALDPAVRSPLLWELLNPVPTVKPTATEAEKVKDLSMRATFIRKLIKQRSEMGDHCLSHIHEVDSDLPEECLMALTDEVPVNLQFLYSAYMIADEFLKIDMVPSYKHYRKMLQLLSFQTGDTVDPKRWLLKCPIHMFFTKDIAAAFPDAKLVWTHRHPISAVPSMCSLLKAVHQIYFESEGRDDKELGRKLKVVSESVLEQAPRDILESGLPCCNVTYNTLVSNPIETVKAIYTQFGWAFTPEYERILTDYLEENRKDRAKRAKGSADLHTYHPEEFGLTEKELSEGAFANYIDKFHVPLSRN